MTFHMYFQPLHEFSTDQSLFGWGGGVVSPFFRRYIDPLTVVSYDDRLLYHLIRY